MSSRRKTHKEFCDEVYKNRNDIEIIGEFLGGHHKIQIKCKKHNHKFDTWTYNITRHKYICPLCRKEQQTERQTLTHNIFLDRLKEINPNIIVISPYKNMHQKINCKCKIDGYEWKALPTNLIDKKSGCPCCSGSVTITGKNDIWTTNPEIVELLVNKDDGFNNTIYSHDKVEFRCPICGEISVKNISNVYHQGFSCPICSDGISYPNKFMYILLKQLGVDFIKEFSPSWSNRKIYDFYIPSKKIIIEMDGGLGHGYRSFNNIKTPEETKQIDILKDKLAENHDITVIRIDCLKSNCDYIKNNICKSVLADIFDLSKINWNAIDIKSRGTLLTDIAVLVNKNYTIQSIAKKLELCEQTIKKYANIAHNHNLCHIPLTDAQLYKYWKEKIEYAKAHPNSLFLKTPTEQTYNLENCKLIDENDLDDSDVFFNAGNQEKLVKELFESTGILVGELKGGENTG